MAVRRERVILDLQDDFSPGMARAAAATALLDKQLRGLDGSSARLKRPVGEAAVETDRLARASGTASREVDGLSRSAKRSESSINQLTGRLRVLADVAAIIGPSLAPIGAVAVPALTGLTSQVGFAVLGVGSLVVASQGLGDALKAVNQAAIEPTASNLAKARDEMAKLGPDAQKFVQRFQQLRPVLNQIRNDAAAGWFPGLTEALDSLEKAAPRVGAIFRAVGSAGGDLVAKGAEALAGPEWASFMEFVERNAPQAIDELGRTIGNLVKGLANMWMAFDPLNDDFSAWLLRQSQAFEKWSAGVSKTEGFQEFVDYIRENGPRVADALGALGNALVQIVEAVAPLGGPSLKIIETFADAIGTLADSDLGTPILAGVAALALYNRALLTTAALQKRIGLSGVGGTAAGPGLMAGRSGAGSALRSSLTGLKSDLGAMTAVWATAGARTERESARLSASTASARKNLAGVAKAGVPAATALGAFAIAASDADHSLAGANASMGLLLGSMAGPWGAAAGLAIGNILDFKSGLEQLDKVIKDGSQQDARDAIDARVAQATNPVAWLTGATGTQAAQDVWKKITTGESESSRLAKKASALAAPSDGILGLFERQKASRQAEAATMGLSSATSDLAAANNVSNAEMARSVMLMNQRTDAALGAFGAETQWREALKAATKQAQSNNAGIRGTSEAALANRQQLESLAGAWKNQRDAMQNAGKSTEVVEAKYRSVRRSFVQTAVAMGVPIQRARALARQLLAVPESVSARVSLTGVSAAEAELIRLTRTRVVNIVASVGRRVSGAIGDALGGSADGSTVPKDGGPYRDRYPYLLAPGEEVISNRFGQADRHRPLLKAINAGMLADGGTAGPRTSPAIRDGAARDAREAAHALKQLAKAAKQLNTQLDKVTSRRDNLLSARSDLTGAISSGLTSDLWGSGEWSNSDPFSILRADIAQARRFNADRARLYGKGLRGQALEDILRAGAEDPTKIRELAGMSAAQIRQYQALFNQRAQLVGSVSAAGGNAVYAKPLAAINKKLDGLEKAIRANTHAQKVEQAKNRHARRASSARAARAGDRGTVKGKK